MSRAGALVPLAVLLALGCGVAADRPAPCEKGALGIEARSKRGGGVEIAEVLRGGPADVSGLREGDLLVQIGDRRLAFACEVDALAFNRDCAPLRIVVQRDGSVIERSVTPVEQASLFAEACARENALACFWKAMFTPDEGSARDDLLDDACERGSEDACAIRGLALLEAKSAGAVMILDRGCNRGSGAACAHLAYAVAEGALVPRDEIRAMELYTRACSLGDGRGCYSMGLFHDNGRGTSTNHTRAASAYEEACNAGVSMSCTNLGFQYEHGRGVIVDQGRAAELYRRGCEGSACEPANLRGCVNLGNAYRDGRGVTQDYARAAEIFRTTCAKEANPQDLGGEKARLRGCVLFAALQFSGSGVAQDEAAAFRASGEGCEKGDAYGCFNVATIHEHRENYVLASAFYDRACEGGDFEGCYELGMLYQDAEGVPFDPDRAATLFRRACKGGFANACKP